MIAAALALPAVVYGIYFFQIPVLHFHAKEERNRLNRATNPFLRVCRSIRVLVRELDEQRARVMAAKGLVWSLREARIDFAVI